MQRGAVYVGLLPERVTEVEVAHGRFSALMGSGAVDSAILSSYFVFLSRKYEWSGMGSRVCFSGRGVVGVLKSDPRPDERARIASGAAHHMGGRGQKTRYDGLAGEHREPPRHPSCKVGDPRKRIY